MKIIIRGRRKGSLQTIAGAFSATSEEVLLTLDGGGEPQGLLLEPGDIFPTDRLLSEASAVITTEG